MEISPAIGITNLIITCLFYVGIVFIVAWLLNPPTRKFGLAIGITWFLTAFAHANIVHFSAFNNVPLGFSIIAPILAFIFSLVLTYKEFREVQGSLIDKQFTGKLVLAVIIVIAFTVLTSMLDMVF